MSKGYKYTGGDLWVSDDGSYGSGQILLVDTRYWLDEDFEALDNARDSEKQVVAVKITKKRNKQFKREMSEMAKAIEKNELRVFIIDDEGVEEIK